MASFRSGHMYKCKKCKALLSMPAALESVEVDTTIFVSSEINASGEESPGPDNTGDADQPQETGPSAGGSVK